MKTIGVMSDTHGDRTAMRSCVAKAPDVDMWFHLGDLVSDAEALRSICGKSVHSVRGNCDIARPSSMKDVEYESVVQVEAVKLLLMHGHRYGVEFLPNLGAVLRAEELDCDVLLHGHTHVSQIDAYGRLTIVNPGSPSRPRGGRKPSFALLELDGTEVRARIVSL